MLLLRFPLSRPDLLKEWLQRINRPEWAVGPNHRLCARHFEAACFDVGPTTIRLKQDAVPTLFLPTPSPVPPGVG